MTKRMHPVAVDLNEKGDIVISQEVADMNDPDPEIRVTPDQAPLLCAWIQQAAGIDQESDDANGRRAVAATFHSDQRGSEPESIEVYVNVAGMVALKINENTSLEISPVMAKRLREQLSRAITASLTDLLRPDSET